MASASTPSADLMRLARQIKCIQENGDEGHLKELEAIMAVQCVQLVELPPFHKQTTMQQYDTLALRMAGTQIVLPNGTSIGLQIESALAFPSGGVLHGDSNVFHPSQVVLAYAWFYQVQVPSGAGRTAAFGSPLNDASGRVTIKSIFNSIAEYAKKVQYDTWKAVVESKIQIYSVDPDVSLVNTFPVFYTLLGRLAVSSNTFIDNSHLIVPNSIKTNTGGTSYITSPFTPQYDAKIPNQATSWMASSWLVAHIYALHKQQLVLPSAAYGGYLTRTISDGDIPEGLTETNRFINKLLGFTQKELLESFQSIVIHHNVSFLVLGMPGLSTNASFTPGPRIPHITLFSGGNSASSNYFNPNCPEVRKFITLQPITKE